MSEITDDLRQAAEVMIETHNFEADRVLELAHFIRDSIREHDNGEILVDTEWLDSQKPRLADDPENEFFSWDFSRHVRVTYEGGSFILQFRGIDMKYSPKRKHITTLLNFIGD